MPEVVAGVAGNFRPGVRARDGSVWFRRREGGLGWAWRYSIIIIVIIVITCAAFWTLMILFLCARVVSMCGIIGEVFL